MKPTLRILSHHHIFYYLAKINICFRWKIDNVSLLTLLILDVYLEINYIGQMYYSSLSKFKCIRPTMSLQLSSILHKAI